MRNGFAGKRRAEPSALRTRVVAGASRRGAARAGEKRRCRSDTRRLLGRGGGAVRAVARELELADLLPVHFVGPVGEAQRARGRIGRGKREVVADAAAA